ncbi:MAG: exodeoxyribonuclease VII small subunit [Clostridia bacterium]|nr:exodeoxyribonuclease VII small subunit [Clostridia bacterium]
MAEQKELTYEQALSELNAVVAEMEKPDATLDELLKLYEKGSRLAVFCAKKLDEAKRKAAAIAGEAGGEAE